MRAVTQAIIEGFAENGALRITEISEDDYGLLISAVFHNRVKEPFEAFGLQALAEKAGGFYGGLKNSFPTEVIKNSYYIFDASSVSIHIACVLMPTYTIVSCLILNA